MVVVHLGNVVAVVAQDREILVHAQAGVRGDVDDVDADVAVAVCGFGRDGVQAGCDDDGRDVAYRHGVDGVDDVRAAGQLDAALEHADEEVVGVADTSGGVSEDVAGADDGSEEAASAGLADELFGYL